MKSFKVLRIKQPIGEFYIASLSSDFIQQVSFTRTAQFEDEGLSGSQRRLRDERTSEIGEYIKTVNAAFPNSIILNANYYENDSLEVDEEKRWQVSKLEKPSDNSGGEKEYFDDVFVMTVPDETLKICSLIDGQHRINGFAESGRSMYLPCAIFLDLPPSMQAYVFATINFNQQKVDKSLAYQLFGYQLDDADNSRWSPDILAVKLSRKFNSKGPFKGRIKLLKDVEYNDEGRKENESGWSISSAAFIEGVVSLISGNAKSDKYIVNKKKAIGIGSRSDLKDNNNYPLRGYYIQGNDKAIQQVLERYFESISSYLWDGKPVDHIVFRTVGIAAQFTFLRDLLKSPGINVSKDLNFDEQLSCLSEVDFVGEEFSPRTATKKRIVDVLKLKVRLLTEDELKHSDDVKRAIINAANSHN